MTASPAVASAAVKVLSNAGVAIAIDDFGTGYTGLWQLRTVTVDEIKIDRTFVSDLLASEPDRSIVQAIIGLTHALGCTVTADGVESEATAQWLQAAGCDSAQGYHFARPAPWPDVLRHLGESAHSVALDPIYPTDSSEPLMNIRPALYRMTAAMVCLLLAGCAQATPDKVAATPSMRAVAHLHNALPLFHPRQRNPAHRDGRVLRPASSFAPDGHTIVGFEPDLGAALGEMLGVGVMFSNHSFTTLAQLVSSHRTDLVISCGTPSPGRCSALRGTARTTGSSFDGE